MDTRKDLIHIDDLFKKLSDGEEPERSGAWLHMKDLLDKEMPVGTVVSGGRSLRRFIVPLLASVLLVGGGLSYYKLNNNNTQPETTPLAATTPGTKAAAPDHSSANTASANGDTRSMVATGAGNGATTATTVGENRAGSAEHNAVHRDRNTPDGTNDHKLAAGPATDRQRHNGTDKKDDRSKAGVHAAAARHTAAGQPAAGQLKPASGTSRNIAAAGTQPGTISRLDGLVEERVIEQIAPAASATKAKNNAQGDVPAVASGRDNTGTEIIPSSGNRNLKQLSVSLDNNVIVKDGEGVLYKEQRDTFKRIDLVERTVPGGTLGNMRNNGGHKVLDTVAITRIEKVSYVPLNRLELASLRKLMVAPATKIIPVTNLHERILAKETVSLVPLNQYKVASRRVDPGKFNQMVQNTSAGIANYFDGSRNFYAAVMVGGNTSFGNPGSFGMQLGIAGLYSLGERLTLAAELRYVNHYFSNYSLEDKSVTFENVNSQQMPGLEWLFTGTRNTVTSSYKINSYGALEMPVTLNYNLGRVSLLAGLNMAYAFPIKWSKENTYNTTDVQQTRSQNENPFKNASFAINEQQDFASRFGLGYVWGLNYDISRKMSLDARVTQILWDNNNGHTDAINRLFRVPTLQLSLGYYFGRKDKVIYIMDKQ